MEKANEIVRNGVKQSNNGVKITESQKNSEKFGTWIPCSERLPVLRDEYIVQIAGWYESTTLIYEPFEMEWIDENDSPYQVLAWMPLPEPYR